MILYHASNIEISVPDIRFSRKKVDFGIGFYTTPLREQAESWCRRKKLEKGQAVISEYLLNDEAFKECKTLSFEYYSGEWLDFVSLCRKGGDESDYDIVSGGVANDRVFNTVELYFDGLISKETAISRLRYEKPNWQVCLRRQDVIEHYLRFTRSEQI